MKSPTTHFVFLILALAFVSMAAADKNYTIGPKDVLEITVFDEKELTRTVVVGPNGKIRFPLLREVEVAGLTVRQVESRIEQALEERFLVDPQVSIVVKEYHSQKVYVLGAITKPGYYSLTGKTTVLEIISIAGGITPQGGKTLILVRGAANGGVALEKIIGTERKADDVVEDFTQKVGTPPIVIDGHKLLDMGDTTLNVELQGGDILYIPKFRKVFVLGEVKRPGGITYDESLTLLKAVTLAGGLTPLGKKKVLVKRIVNGKEKQFKVNLNTIIKDSEKDIPLMAEDVIVVPRRIF